MSESLNKTSVAILYVFSKILWNEDIWQKISPKNKEEVERAFSEVEKFIFGEK